MYYLIFDSETTGLPRRWNAPITDTNNWPRLVELAWLEYSYSGHELSRHSYIIKPDGFSIPFEASQIHGITTDIAYKSGVPLEDVLYEFSQAVERATILVSHNMDFEEKIIGAEFLRAEIETFFFRSIKICTMKRSTDLCRLHVGPRGGYKWPKLSELYFALFRNELAQRHNAIADAYACAKCFFELQKRGIIPHTDDRGSL